MSSEPAFARSDATVAASWRRAHQTDEETHVVVLDLAGELFVAAAMDFSAEGELSASEEIATTVTEAEAERRAERWLQDNPKGIAGDGPLGGVLG